MELHDHVRGYYELGREHDRLLRPGSGALEYERTRELLTAALPAGNLEVLDVGGAAGIHARWLADLGHRVRVLDPVPLHVEQATDAGLDAALGDARAVDEPDASVDVVLLLGPLYHLQEPGDRALALAEARRVLRPGGLLAAAAIGRHAAFLDLLLRYDRLGEPEVLEIVARALDTGRFDGWDGALFTHAYLHLPDELLQELATAGFDDVALHTIEGPGAFAHDLTDRWEDPARREVLLTAARVADQHPALLHVASHLLAMAHRPR